MKNSKQMKKTTKETKRYLYKIKKQLPVYRKEEKLFLKRLSNSIYEYVETCSNDTMTMDELIKKFGEPEDCVSTYVETLDNEDIKLNIAKRRHMKYALTVLTVLCVAAICVAIYFYKQRKYQQEADIYSETIVIQEYAPYPVNRDDGSERVIAVSVPESDSESSTSEDN